MQITLSAVHMWKIQFPESRVPNEILGATFVSIPYYLCVAGLEECPIDKIVRFTRTIISGWLENQPVGANSRL